ncbi:hypothetical protein D3C87_2183150 [compost metagenome]
MHLTLKSFSLGRERRKLGTACDTLLLEFLGRNKAEITMDRMIAEIGKKRDGDCRQD